MIIWFDVCCIHIRIHNTNNIQNLQKKACDAQLIPPMEFPALSPYDNSKLIILNSYMVFCRTTKYQRILEPVFQNMREGISGPGSCKDRALGHSTIGSDTGLATSHYLNQWWPRLPTHICVIRPQWRPLYQVLTFQKIYRNIRYQTWHFVCMSLSGNRTGRADFLCGLVYEACSWKLISWTVFAF